MLTCHDNSPPLQNGHHFTDLAKSHASNNESAHTNNLHVDTHDFAPATNGVSDSQDHHLANPRTSFESSSDLANSGDTGDNHVLSSSQSVLDDGGDLPEVKPNSMDMNSAPAVVQPPTSDLRNETLPAIEEQKSGHDQPEQEHESPNEPVSEATNPTGMTQPSTVTSDPVPKSESNLPSPPQEPEPKVTDATESKQDQGQASPTVTTSSAQSLSIPTKELPNHPPVPVPDGSMAEVPPDPAPSPAPATATSLPPQQSTSTNDQIMQDAPTLPSKASREREDDEVENGPATKRAKTEQDSGDFKVPERPVINTQVNGEQASETSKWSRPMTTPQHKALVKAIGNVKRIQASLAFRLPVDVVALKIPTYFDYVKKPMDLRTLEENLKAGKYPTVEAFLADFNQIIENCRIFNGPTHTITQAAYAMKENFDRHVDKLPGPDEVDPSPAEKKKKTILPPAPKVSAPRRESRSSLPGTARSPGSTPSTPAFALGPQGVPLIRRDSTIGDGRPKREIHPPAPRDLPYANQKPKKKKYMVELKFCEKVWNEIAKPRYMSISYAFMAPVDPVALNIPTYHSIIKKPMDFGTIKSKLDQGEYENAKEFESDARQVFQNCYKFNRQGDAVHRAGQELESIFDSEWSKKRDWVEANTPASGAQSPGSSEAEDSDEEVEEEEEDEDEKDAALKRLQQQIAGLSKEVELITKGGKKKSPPVSNKKAAKSAKAPRKDSKKTAAQVKPEKNRLMQKTTKKTPYVTYEQKQDISNRINGLSEGKMATALNIIRSSMPNLKVRPYKRIYLYISIQAILDNELDTDYPKIKGVQDDELELDIDELDDEVLHKLLVFVRKHAPRAEDPPPRPPPTSSAAPTKKKNKPMSKHEQEARIAQVQSGLSAFQNPGSAHVCKFSSHSSAHAGPSSLCNVDSDAGPDQDSSDGGESSESEEE